MYAVERGMLRPAIRTALTVILIGLTGFIVWAGATHQVSYVVTNGVSMLPLYHAGDLVVVVDKDTYQIGDIVAYRSGRLTVLHRIIGGDPDSGFVIKGDNNQSTDPKRPTSAQLLGRAVLHVPAGGIWLRRLTSAPVLGALAYIMTIGAGGTVLRRRGRRRGAVRKPHIPSVSYAATRALSATSSRRLRTTAGGIVVVGMFGTVLGFAAWTQPASRWVTTTQPSPARTVTFSYAAAVARTLAYDGTTVKSPEPVFRKVATNVDVDFTYHGPSGTVAVQAELSAAGGWHSTVPLAPLRPFTGTRYRDTVRLDLDALETRIRAGTAAAGIVATDMHVAVVPRITDATGTPFQPALKLQLTTAALTVADSPLVVVDTAPPPAKTLTPQTLRIAGRDLARVSTARTWSTVLLLTAILAAALLVARNRTRSTTESDSIRQRYEPLLVEVQPMDPAAGGSVVHVTEFRTLARLAERYGLLILHWSTPESTTFAVKDDTTSYVYRLDSRPETRDDQEAPHQERPFPADRPVGAPAGVGKPADSGDSASWHRQRPIPDEAAEPADLRSATLFESEVQSSIDALAAGRQLFLTLIDLDDVDSLDGQHGPGAADAVLLTIAERIRRSVRPRDLVAKLDDARFAVLIEDLQPEVVDTVTKRIMRTVGESVPIRGTLTWVRASVGVAQADPTRPAAVTIEHATIALAEAKAATKECLAWFNSVGQNHTPEASS
jgi:signal peptidase I